MKIKNKLQKLALITTALVSTMPAYAISPGGAAAATAGSLVGAYIIGKLVSTHYKHKHEDEDRCDSCQAKKKQRIEREQRQEETRNAMKDDLKEYKKDHAKKKADLSKSQREDKKRAKKGESKVTDSLKTKTLKSEIAELEAMIDDLKQKIKNMD